MRNLGRHRLLRHMQSPRSSEGRNARGREYEWMHMQLVCDASRRRQYRDKVSLQGEGYSQYVAAIVFSYDVIHRVPYAFRHNHFCLHLFIYLQKKVSRASYSSLKGQNKWTCKYCSFQRHKMSPTSLESPFLFYAHWTSDWRGTLTLMWRKPKRHIQSPHLLEYVYTHTMYIYRCVDKKIKCNQILS